ncbi:MAG: cytochrome c [Acidimicrobiales bacterium]|nr:cytochrome c [Acidimicrobiales bacterium]
MARSTELRTHRRRVWVLGVVALVIGTGWSLAGTAGAQDDTSTTTTAAADGAGGADEAQLAQGAAVFSSNCASCHQAGGVGLSGQFPPLKGNPNVTDPAYVAKTVQSGKTGALEVNGQSYNGVMPAFPTLSDEDVAAVAAYVSAGFPSVGSAEAAAGSTDAASSSLPGIANLSWVLAMLVGIGVAALVVGPRLIGPVDRATVPWPVAWLKAGVIVVGIVIGTVIVPSWVLQLDAVAELDRKVQDLIAVVLWGGALGACIWALWYAGRKYRI